MQEVTWSQGPLSMASISDFSVSILLNVQPPFIVLSWMSMFSSAVSLK